MEITIREYEERDRQNFVDFGNDEENYLAGLDPLKQRRFFEKGYEGYTNWLFKHLEANSGIIFVAVDGDKTIGHIAGRLNPQSEEDQILSLPAKPAFVDDLYIIPDYRSQGVGAKLLKHMEEYFKAQGCDEISLEAFAPNERSLTFYDREGYSRQTTGFTKRL